MEPGSPLYDTATVRAIDREAIASGTPGFVLMQRAARAAFALLRREWPQAGRVVVMCGNGNNGGDGYLLAALLHEAGLRVHACGASLREHTSADARRARAEWEQVAAVDDLDGIACQEADVIVDALFGIGLARPPEGEMAQAIERINAHRAPVFALDVPSGLDADRGTAPGVVVRAAHTLTFIADKTGLHTSLAREVCGRVHVDDLGLGVDAQPQARLLREDDLAHWLRPRSRIAHKGSHGHVLCIGGDQGMGGAVRLCAEGALRAGAGYTSVATRAEHVAPLLAARPEAMTRAVECDGDLAPLLERATVIALGPGLGRGEWGRAMLAAALRASTLPVRDADVRPSTPQVRDADALRPSTPLILDADALNLIAQRHDEPPTITGAVLTPHPAEAARLLRVRTEDVEFDRYAAAAQLAARYDAVVVLKGAGTIVAAPGRTPCVIAAGNPGMASAGMGDVLTGVIAALRAQGLDAVDAACAGALLHAAAGDVAAHERGERGLLASDLFTPLQRLANPA